MIQWIECQKEMPKAFATVWVKVIGKKKAIKAWWSESLGCWCRKMEQPTNRLWGTELKIKQEVTHWKKIKKSNYELEF